ncbi:MAG: tetratricopeptide repeat protein [Betaproteobacteria bacterium]|nr:tetratricopeptide repeat protein [Betaproteobacteria bacterium]
MSTPTAELKAIGATALAHQVAGRFAEAAQVYATLLSRAPHSWAACYNLALVYQHLQRLPEAAEMYARAVRLNPQLAEGYNNLGNVLKALKNDDAAIEAFRQALSLNPKLSEAGYNLAIMLQVRGQFDASIDVLRQAVADNPSHGNAWDSLYRTLLGLGRQEDAIQAFLEWERAVQPSPELVVAGLALSRPMGDRERESRYLALALAWPFAEFTPGQFAPILGLIQYFDVSREEIFACYRRYDSAVSALNPSPVALLTRRAADARLRIGYVSGDFRQHVMGRLMLNVIASHDRSRFSILLISTCARTQHDAITAAFQQHADGFADISELDDFAAAKSIAEADIDVLVDLSGHTNSARPGIYAHRPARSIVTHLGYHGCLGLSAVDYKLTDHVADLEDAAAYQIEPPYALETCVFPLLRGLPVEIDPELATDLNLAGKFVFGAFLNILKLSSRCLGLWRRVLDAVPE